MTLLSMALCYYCLIAEQFFAYIQRIHFGLTVSSTQSVGLVLYNIGLHYGTWTQCALLFQRPFRSFVYFRFYFLLPG